jgi:GTPase SAR1 family protein
MGPNNYVYAVINRRGNHYAAPIGSREILNIIRALAKEDGINLSRSNLNELIDILESEAENADIHRDIYYRVANIGDTIFIDLGDRAHTHLKITAGKVEIIKEGSEALFYRTPVSQPFVIPAEEGNLLLLKKYLNLDEVDAILLIAWISYTLALSKKSTSNYVILVLEGDQGSGKTSLCNNVIINLIDPNAVGVQMLPTNTKDLAIAANNSHILCYDNIRYLKRGMADSLCVASTGGALSSRQLYSDADQHFLRLHVALVLNGIHAFMDQPDLAQRSLPIRLKTLSSKDRKSEAVLQSELENDMPFILRGLFELISKILEKLPQAEVIYPERMYEFSQWLAAYELVDGVPPGTYQKAYSNALNEAQLDTLLSNPLAEAVYRFTKGLSKGSWSGTPTQLLTALDQLINIPTQRSRDWPQNAISLSKRLTPLSAGLSTQGIIVEFTRGKDRKITITNEEAF